MKRSTLLLFIFFLIIVGCDTGERTSPNKGNSDPQVEYFADKGVG